MDQYYVQSPDGKEFGPTDLAGLQQWVREGRVLPHTRIRKNSEGAFIAAELLAELSPMFAMPAGAPAPPIATTVALPSEFGAWSFIGLAWDIVKPHWLPLSLMCVIIAGINAVPYLGSCVSLIIGGALMVGYNRAILGMLAGRPPTVEMLFGGFDRFGQAFLAWLAVTILVGLGFVLLIVPGIILAIMWMFVSLVLAETDLDFSSAMTASANLTKGYRWQLFGLLFACVCIAILGLLACCVGIFLAQPVAMTAVALAYRFLQGRQAAPAAPAAV